MTEPITAPPDRRGTPLYLGGFVLLGLSVTLLGPSLDTFQRITNTPTNAGIGVLIVAAAAGYLVGALSCGFALRSMSAHRVMASGMIVGAVAIAAMPSMHGRWTLFGLQALLGLSMGFVDVTGNAVVLWVHRGGAVMNALHMAFSVGAVLSPVFVGRSLHWTDGLGLAYGIVAALMIAGAAALLLVPSPANPHAEEARGIPAGRGRLLAVAVLFYVFYVGLEMGFINWIFKYGEVRGLGEQTANRLGTVFLLSFMIGRIVSVPLARMLRPLQAMLIDIAVCIAGAGAMLAGGDNRATIWGGTIVFGLGTASMFPTMLALAEPAIPSTSTVASSYLFGGSIGGIALPWLTGLLLDEVGAKALPLVTLISTVICLAIVATFVRMSAAVSGQA